MPDVPDVDPRVVGEFLASSRVRRGSEKGIVELALVRGLRDRSDAVRNVLASGAVHGESWASVQAAVLNREVDVGDWTERHRAPWWRALARITFLHARHADDVNLAADFFELAARCDGNSALNRGEFLCLAQVLWDTGRDELSTLPSPPSSLSPTERGLLDLDQISRTRGVGSDVWLARLNAVLDDSSSPASIQFVSGEGSWFDRLSAPVQRPILDGPLITVILTTFQRDAELYTSVRSILSQSWSNLELIVVDDCSGPSFQATLDDVDGSDPRVRVMRQPHNGGTYVGRNTALAAARGEFVTFQDDDDWSHPERLARQVQPMLDDESVHSTLSLSVRASSNLEFRYGAMMASRVNRSSLMFRRRVLDRLGGFDPVRKSADVEFIDRLKVGVRGKQATLPEILAFVRLTESSLSRSDFSVDWSEPSRSEYAESYAAWHRDIARGVSPAIDTSGETRSFPAPRRFLPPAGLERVPGEYDIVLLADWSTPVQWGMPSWNALRACVRTDLRIGIIHIIDPLRGEGRASPISDEVRTWIHQGRIDRILPTDSLRTPRLVVFDAALLEVSDRARWAMHCERAAVVVRDMPVEAGVSSRWSIADCASALHEMFAPRFTEWVGTDGEATRAIERAGHETTVVSTVEFFDDEPLPPLSRGTGSVPVIGRCAPEVPLGWPQDRAVFEAFCEAVRDADVRMLGKPWGLRASKHEAPTDWVWFDHRDLPLGAFLQQIDFYVLFADAAPDSFELAAIKSAVLAGRVVLVDARWAGECADLVVACTPAELSATTRRLFGDVAAYDNQVDRARQALVGRDREAMRDFLLATRGPSGG